MKLQGFFDYTQRDFWGGPYYQYWMLIVATVLLGIVGGDHLFLRSPTSALLKLIINVLGLGIWWIYDIIQIVGEKETVMKHGLSAPIIGPLGIGAGMFVDNQPDAPKAKAPFRYLAYLPLLFFPYGFDRLVAGDTNGAMAKFFASVFFVLTYITWFIIFPTFPVFPLHPILFLWNLTDLFKAVFQPKKFFTTGLARFMPFSWFMSPEGLNKLGPVDVPDQPPDECDAGGGGLGGLISNMIKKVFNMIFFFVPPIVQTVINTLLPGLIPAVTATSKAVELGAKTTSEVIGAIRNPAVATAGTSSALVQAIPQAVQAVPQVASQVGSQLSSFTDPKKLQEMATVIPPANVMTQPLATGMAPGMPPPMMPAGMPPMMPQPMMPQMPQMGPMTGGGLIGGGLTEPDSDFSSMALLCLFSGILLGGSIYAIKRLNKYRENLSNGDKGRERNDSPPKPSRF
jgi:hypothetical protein